MLLKKCSYDKVIQLKILLWILELRHSLKQHLMKIYWPDLVWLDCISVFPGTKLNMIKNAIDPVMKEIDCMSCKVYREIQVKQMRCV